MKYAAIKFNDVSNAPGIAVSLFTQGCPHHCKGCFNETTWDFDGGQEFTQETMNSIIEGISANGISRSLCILGGEPLCPENQFLTRLVINEVKKHYPNIKIYIWTGYTYDYLLKNMTPSLKDIFNSIYCLIDGPFIESQKDLNLEMRGSANQKIYYFDKKENL